MLYFTTNRLCSNREVRSSIGIRKFGDFSVFRIRFADIHECCLCCQLHFEYWSLLNDNKFLYNFDNNSERRNISNLHIFVHIAANPSINNLEDKFRSYIYNNAIRYWCYYPLTTSKLIFKNSNNTALQCWWWKLNNTQLQSPRKLAGTRFAVDINGCMWYVNMTECLH